MKAAYRSYLAVITCGVVSATTPPAAQAEFKCDGRQLARVDATACAHAARGAESLLRFITRTQAIYGLQMRDYARFVGDEEPRAKAATVAAAVAKGHAASK